MTLLKNIVFDLGGVIETISPQRVIEHFKDIGIRDADRFFSLYRQSEICSKFETGHISTHEFLSHIRSLCEKEVSDEAIIHAWCANQLGVEDSVLSVIHALKKRGYFLYILSNTNPIHYEMIIDHFNKRHGEDFEALFDHIYLSYQINKRKPEISPYQHLVSEGILPEESAYIDDLADNLNWPKNLGFTTLLHPTNASIHYLLDRFP